jgi:aerobic carbon-monoxide dehydrogenase medium subunit
LFGAGPRALSGAGLTGRETHHDVKPAPFAYHRPETLEEAVALLAAYGPDAKVLAGGQSLMPLMNFRLARPAHVVDINRLAALQCERVDTGALRLGALTRHRRLTEASFRGKCQLLWMVSPFIGHPQIRTRGTLGGSAAHADSTAELPGALLALDAEIVAVSSRGQRTIAAESFFVHYMTTALADDEILTEVRIPRYPGSEGCGFAEVAARHGDFALAGSMVRLLRADGPARAGARVVLIGCGPTPLRIRAAEHVLIEAGVTSRSVSEAADVVRENISPSPRSGASKEYLVRLAGALTRRSILEAEASLRGHDSDH